MPNGNTRRNRRRFIQRQLYFDLPQHERKLRLADFLSWLGANAATILPITDEWQIARYRTAGGKVQHLYKNLHGEITWSPTTAAHYRVFLASKGLPRQAS